MSAPTEQVRRAVFGLQFRTTILLTGVVLAATGLTGALYLRISARLTLTEAKSHAKHLAKALAIASARAVQNQDEKRLLRIAEETVAEGGLSYVIFADVTGRMLASYQKGAGQMTHLVMDEDGDRVSVEPIDRPRVTTEGGGQNVDVVYPVPVADLLDEKVDSANPTVGFVRLGVSLAESQTRLASEVRNILGVAIGIALLMVPLGYEVVRSLTRPINRIAQAARSLAAGQWSVRVEESRRDELGELASTFNTMADDLAQSHNHLIELNTELEDRVLQRTEMLEDANKRLRDMASRDSLTGLCNRRHFEDILAQSFAESARYRTDLTCMMLDLDNFKQVNDTLGHHVGDRLLQLTAETIRASIREADFAIRYGGDEFIILLPQTPPGDAMASASRLLRNFREALVRAMSEAAITSLSIGLASRENDQPSTAMELVNLADEAMYLAKAGGKNRITVVRPGAIDGAAQPAR